MRIPIIGIQRTVFVIAQDGTILYRQNGSPALLEVIKGLAQNTKE